jgi:hypothetical protein
MIEKIIENRTPYLGKMILKFEKNPYYSSSMDGKLNKVHLNLGFTKLVTRFIPNQVMTGHSNIDPKKVELIEKYTGGVIGTHKWGDNDNDEFVLEDSFLTKDGKYIGNIDTAWFYYTNNLYVCREYPHGVALKLKDYVPYIIFHNTLKDEYENFVTEQIENDNVKGYYGYTHRGGGLFKIGDRLFDEEYSPVVEDYDEKEFKKWWKKYTKLYKKGDDFDKKWIYNDGIKSVIPFNKRGKHMIKNWEDARTAAINMSKYLS